MKLGISLPQGIHRGRGDLLEAVDELAVPVSHVGIWCSWNVEDDEGPPSARFPMREVKGLTARGIRPVIHWQPAGAASDHDSILRGDHDAYLTRWASDVADFGGPVIVRFAWEQNGGMPWGIQRHSNTADSYVAMWRYVVGMVRPIAPRALFLWTPNVTPRAGIAPTFPGDAYVDRVGVDGYNGWDGTLKHPADIYGPSLDILRDISERPVIIGEFAIADDIDGRAKCFRETVEYLDEEGVTAALYFNLDGREWGHPDWRMGHGMREAWREMAA